VAADACLAAVFVAALETLVFSLIPLRFLDGANVTAWSRRAWIMLFAGAVFAFVHILLTSNGHPHQASPEWVTLALFVGFGLFSIGFWAYFRYRPAWMRPGHRDLRRLGRA
jgi:quinol-cytochrome oxidoreductase complex cytochrome b subunit